MAASAAAAALAASAAAAALAASVFVSTSTSIGPGVLLAVTWALGFAIMLPEFAIGLLENPATLASAAIPSVLSAKDEVLALGAATPVTEGAASFGESPVALSTEGPAGVGAPIYAPSSDIGVVMVSEVLPVPDAVLKPSAASP